MSMPDGRPANGRANDCWRRARRRFRDAELLAMFLGTGVRGKSALDLARELLARFGGFARAVRQPTARRGVPGGGPAKYAQIAAVMELARRALREEMRARAARSTSPRAVRDYLRLRSQEREHEFFFACSWTRRTA